MTHSIDKLRRATPDCALTVPRSDARRGSEAVTRATVAERTTLGVAGKARPKRDELEDVAHEAASTRATGGVAKSVKRQAASRAKAEGKSVSAASVLCGRPLEVAGTAALARLNETQAHALAHATRSAKTLSRAAHAPLVARLAALGFGEADLARCLAYMRDEAPATVNFHPDKALSLAVNRADLKTPHYSVTVDRTRTVIDAFLADSLYRNQFETGVTSGASTAFPGGSRDEWEKTIFRGDYHEHALVPGERPRYGAINVELKMAGPASQYGSCYFVLKPEVRARVTITPKNSCTCEASDVGTLASCEHVLAGMPEERLKALMDAAVHGTRSTERSWSYVEMQIHGPLEFATDVFGVVADAKFRGTPYEDKLRRFAAANGLELAWQDGSAVTPDAS